MDNEQENLLALLQRAYPWVAAYGTGTRLHEELYWKLVLSGRIPRQPPVEERFEKARVISSGADN